MLIIYQRFYFPSASCQEKNSEPSFRNPCSQGRSFSQLVNKSTTFLSFVCANFITIDSAFPTCVSFPVLLRPSLTSKIRSKQQWVTNALRRKVLITVFMYLIFFFRSRSNYFVQAWIARLVTWYPSLFPIGQFLRRTCFSLKHFVT